MFLEHTTHAFRIYVELNIQVSERLYRGRRAFSVLDTRVNHSDVSLLRKLQTALVFSSLQLQFTTLRKVLLRRELSSKRVASHAQILMTAQQIT